MTDTYDNLVNDILVENLNREDAIDDTEDPPEKLSLEELDHKLENNIDEDFFEEPIKFTKTLQRVIDVLGAQFHDDGSMEAGSNGGGAVDMTKNPAYRSLQRQMNVVESSIEQVAMAHCSELNESVVGVGKVAREFNEAVSVVKKLRSQVKQIKRSLNPKIGNGDVKMNGKDGLSNEDDGSSTEVVTTTAKDKGTNVSLRELWMKKLECEAVLSILDKLVIVRDAPSGFDALIEPRNGSCCRIIAAVTLLTNAITTMNSDDLSQVMAVTKVYQQLMSRKQRAEEIVWDTLNDVVYLRTGNSKQAALLAEYAASKKKKKGGGHLKLMVPGFYHSNHGNSGEDQSMLHTLQESDDSSDDEITEVSSRGEGYAASVQHHCKRVIPKTYLEEEINLEEEEKICLEDASSVPWDPRYPNEPILFRPKYSDATLALRLLTEAITKLRRLDDVERYLNESVEAELKRIAEREQMRTLALLEKRRGHRLPNVAKVSSTSNTSAVAGTSASAVSNYQRQQPLPMEFKHHLSSLLFAYGNVMVRLSHLAQIIRHKISSDSTIATPSYPSQSSALHSVLTSAFSIMQREIKLFLKSCVEARSSSILSTFQNKNNQQNRSRGAGSAATAFNQPSEEYVDEGGIFSLGVIEQSSTDKKLGGRSNYSHHIMSHAGLTADTFVTTILLPKTHTSAQPRFALSFRRGLERWTYDCMQLKNELALVTNEDQIFDSSSDDTALKYLDSVIESKLLINLQDHALQNIVSALEKPDSFDPDLDSSHHHSSSDSKHALMCVACKKLLENIMPLLMALHRLPRGEKMSTAVAAVLDMAMLAFLSRVKQRVGELCTNKTAYELMGSYESATSPGMSKSDSLSVAMETRKAYSLFLQEYYGHDSIDDISSTNLQANNSAAVSSSQGTNPNTPNAPTFDHFTSDLEKEHKCLAKEVENIVPLLKFPEHDHGYNLQVCAEEDLKKSSCLAHSLLQLSDVLISSLQNKRTRKWKKSCTKSLRTHLMTIRSAGIFMSKFCRIDMLVQTVKRMAQISKSSAIISKDTIRLPACVNDLGEYLSNASDILRDAAGNALAAYTFSSLEQYIPLLLMQSVRVIASDGTIITLNGIESLDRCGSVLYRDLKGATGFEGSFWDEAAAADAFERSASFLALLELTMEELEKFWREHPCDFSDEDYKLLFSIHCPRRTGDLQYYARLKDDLILMQGNVNSGSASRNGGHKV